MTNLELFGELSFSKNYSNDIESFTTKTSTAKPSKSQSKKAGSIIGTENLLLSLEHSSSKPIQIVKTNAGCANDGKSPSQIPTPENLATSAEIVPNTAKVMPEIIGPVSKRALARLAGDTVICTNRPTTLSEAIDVIESSGTLGAKRIKSFRSDVQWVQIRLPRNKDGSLSPQLPCDPMLLRPILQKIRPAKFNVSEKRFFNIRSEIAAIQRKTGWLTPRNGQIKLKSDYWNIGLAKIARQATFTFRSFAAYCEGLDLEPHDVTIEHLAQYQLHSETTKSRLYPTDTIDALRYAWNKLCHSLPGWTGHEFPKKQSRLTIRESVEKVSTEFLADLQNYAENLRKPALFDHRFPRKLSEKTIETRTGILILARTVLIERGWDRYLFNSLKILTFPTAIKDILTAYYERNCQTSGWTYGAETTASVLKTLAIQWGNLSPKDLAEIEKICASVRRKKSAFPVKTQERLRQFDDKNVERKFWDLPRKIWDEIIPRHEKNGRFIRAAQLAKIAVALAIAFDKPLRISNLTRLDLEHDFLRDKMGKITGIKIEGERTTKNAPIIEGAICAKTQKMIVQFIEKFRPRLLLHPTSALFPGQKNEYLSEGSLGIYITQTIEKNLGAHVNPHLIRSFIATVILDENPRNGFLAQRALDHKSILTTHRHYAMQRGRATAEQYAEVIKQRMKRLSK